jgi:putative phosphoesterase
VVIGLISDTHGLLRPEIFEALAGVETILHAGDVGGARILTELRSIAAVRAVYGNADPPGEPGLASDIGLQLGGLSIHLSHGHELGRPTPERLLERYEADVIVYGHTHRPLVERAGARLVVNPGAAGPRRFDLKPSVARMTIENGKADVQIVWL